MAYDRDSQLIFERYVKNNILDDSIYNTNSVGVVFISESTIVESVLEEGIGDFLSKVGGGVKQFAGKIKQKLEDFIVNEIKKRLDPNEAKKAVQSIESGNLPKEAVTEVGKDFKSPQLNECTLYTDALTEDVLSELAFDLLIEARKPLTREQKDKKNQRERERRAAKKSPSTKSDTFYPTKTEDAPVEPEQEDLKVRDFINGIVKLLNSKYATANKKAKVYSAIDSKIRQKLGQDVNEVLRNNQVFGDVQKLQKLKTAPKTSLRTYLLEPIANEFIRFATTKNVEGNLSEEFNKVLKWMEWDESKQKVINIKQTQAPEFNKTVKIQEPDVDPKLKPFIDWFKGALQHLEQAERPLVEKNPKYKSIIEGDVYRSYISSIQKKVNFILNHPALMKKAQEENAKNKESAEKIINAIGSPNASDDSTSTITNKSFLSTIWNWVKNHKTLTASSLVGLIGVIAYVSGGTSLLLPLLFKAIKAAAYPSLVGGAVNAGKQAARTGSVDWKKVAKSAGLAGLATMGLSMLSGVADYGLSDYGSSDTSIETPADTTEVPTEEPSVEQTPEQPVATTEPAPESSEDLFKKLNKSEFDPNSKLDRFKKGILDKLQNMGLSGKSLIDKYNTLVKRSPSNYQW